MERRLVVSPWLPSNVFPLKQRRVTWQLDGGIGDAKVVRLGFPLVPSFSGAAHSYTGATLAKAIVDCLDMAMTPKIEDMTKAYVCISRVRQAHDLLIAQPFTPALFKQGVIIGPHLLLRRFKESLSEASVEDEWQRLESAYKDVTRAFKGLSWQCGECMALKSIVDYEGGPNCEELGKYIATCGQWRRCTECSSGVRYLCTQCNACFPASKFDATAMQWSDKSELKCLACEANHVYMAKCAECLRD